MKRSKRGKRENMSEEENKGKGVQIQIFILFLMQRNNKVDQNTLSKKKSS